MVVNIYIDRFSTKLDCKDIFDNFMKVFTNFVANSEEGVMDILNKDSYPSKEEGTKAISAIRKGFKSYLDTYCEYITDVSLTEEDKEFLINNVGVNLSSDIRDMEENGNSWYWLSHSGAVINQ